MATVTSQDITNFYDFGRANDPSDVNASHRMYFDYLSAVGSNKLMITDADFNILSSYQAWPGSSIIVDAPPAIIDRVDICVLNDQGLNSFPPRANQTNPIYRLYLAERTIIVNVPTLVTVWTIPYTDASGSFIIGQSITGAPSGGIGIIVNDIVTARGQGILTVYATSGVFAANDEIKSGAITATAGAGTVSSGEETVNIETEYNCSLLIVNQKFEIEFIIPLIEGILPLQSFEPYICCSYDYGFNAQESDQNYIWHMYVGKYNIDEVPTPNCLLIVNQDFKVTCYQTPIP